MTTTVEWRTQDEILAGVPLNPEAEGYRPIRITQLQESEWNPRKHFDRVKLEELADSMREHGILTPLLVRPGWTPVDHDQMYDIAAGHRRFRAAKIAGLAVVPCVVRVMDDRTFLEVLCIENLQREDVHPLEEAEGFAELLKRPECDASTIAERLGKSEAYVYGRLQLLDLADDVRAAFLADSITIGHARILARLAPEIQADGLKHCFEHDWQTRKDKLVSVADLKNWARGNCANSLDRAPFDLAGDFGDYAPACTLCPKAPGVNPLLVDPDGDKLCLDPACYSRKVEAHVAAQTKAGLVAISTSWGAANVPAGVLMHLGYEEIHCAADPEDESSLEDLRTELREMGDVPDNDPNARDIMEQIRDLEEAMQSQVKDCGHSEAAVVVHGNETGKVTRICRDPKCPVHGARVSRSMDSAADDTREREKARKKAEKRKLAENAKQAARRQAIGEIADYMTMIELRPFLIKILLNRISTVDSLREIASQYEIEAPKKGGVYDLCSLMLASFRERWKDGGVAEAGEMDYLIVRLMLCDQVVRIEGRQRGNDLLAEMAEVCGVDLKTLEASHLKRLKKLALAKKAAKKRAKK